MAKLRSRTDALQRPPLFLWKGGKIHVLIADDHPVLRKGVRQILEETTDIVAAGEASSGEEVLAILTRGQWDVVLLDITFPDRNGLEILREIRKDHPSLPVLFLSMHSEEQFAIRSLKAGASGYLTKESAPEELVQAIRKVVRGGKYLTPSLTEKLALYIQVENEVPHDRLSDREFQLLRLLATGMSVKEVADKLRLSVKTVSTYRMRLLEKMGMKTNAELIRYALENHLVE